MRLPIAIVAHVVLVLFGLTVLGGAGSAQTTTPQSPGTVLVIDGSGSMWGELAGERSSKLELTQQAVRQSLAKVGTGARLAFVSFGHRRRARTKMGIRSSNP